MFEDISKVLLITDMDGTFLPASKIPSKENIDAVNRLMNAGGKFSIATGRSLQASMQYFDTVSVNCPIIMCNGAMVYDLQNKKQLYDVYLPESARELVEKVIRDNPDVGCEVLPLENVYVPNMTDMEREHCGICKVEPVICDIKDTPHNWYKALFAQTADRLHEVVEYIEAIKNEYCDMDFVISSPTYYEILPKNISKGSALKEMRRVCGFDDYTIVAVGDYNNDIEMLLYADVGICPSNAAEEVKTAADIVLDVSCEESAIAAVVDYIFDKTGR
ncbi:MAG: HAD family hydrolase [Oscillospiraceae bacterium]